MRHPVVVAAHEHDIEVGIDLLLIDVASAHLEELIDGDLVLARVVERLKLRKEVDHLLIQPGDLSAAHCDAHKRRGDALGCRLPARNLFDGTVVEVRLTNEVAVLHDEHPVQRLELRRIGVRLVEQLAFKPLRFRCRNLPV